MSCQPAARDAVRAAQRALVDVDCVADATVFAPDVGPRDCWVLEVIVADPDRVPNVVVDELGSAGLSSARASTVSSSRRLSSDTLFSMVVLYWHG